jgi:PAS domain S-box-containing protein
MRPRKKAKRPSTSAGVRDLRSAAESRLLQMPKKRVTIEKRADAQRLLQELQIHKIELELQNEELRQSKSDLETALVKFSDLYDSAPVGYFSLDEHGLILEVNLTGSAMLGTERDHLAGRRFQLFVAPQYRPAFNVFLEGVFTGHDRRSCEVSLLSAGHAPFWADLQAMSATSPGGAPQPCLMAIVDITARRQAEEAQRNIDIMGATNRKLQDEIIRRQAVELSLRKSEQRAHQLLGHSRHLQSKLRQMSHQIFLVQENQRKEISRELHDEISQLLLSINLHLAIFDSNTAINPKSIRRNITRVRWLVEKSVRIVHDFARELRPPMLDDLGLIPAINTHIADFSKRKGLKIQFTAFKGVEAFEGDKRTVLYRVTQEALANVAKHARASVVKVLIVKVEGGACLEISDNGKAFDIGRLSSAEWGDRLGLMGMRERVEMVGGRFSVESASGAGTTIRAEIPFGKSRLSTHEPDRGDSSFSEETGKPTRVTS